MKYSFFTNNIQYTLTYIFEIQILTSESNLPCNPIHFSILSPYANFLLAILAPNSFHSPNGKLNLPEPLNITVWMSQSFTQNFDSIILQVIVPKVQAPQVWVVQNSRSQVQTTGTSENTTHQPVRKKSESETFSCEA